MFALGTDSSFSPNLFLSNTTSIYSAPNLSIGCNSSVPLTPASSQSPSPAKAPS